MWETRARDLAEQAPVNHEIVTVTAGEYFFVPSVKALKHLAGGATASHDEHARYGHDRHDHDDILRELALPESLVRVAGPDAPFNSSDPDAAQVVPLKPRPPSAPLARSATR